MFKFPRPQRRIDNKRMTSIIEKGISITPMPVTVDEAVIINYDGLLAQNGAASVYAHVGYGSAGQWVSIQDLPMEKIENVWTCELVPNDTRLNFCFHDGANNWDNNYGYNWSLAIHNGR